jgi:uncharacterized repeat protein (TIGR03803 family)
MICLQRRPRISIRRTLAITAIGGAIAAIALAAAPPAHAQTYTVLHNFNTVLGESEGSYPNGDMIQDSDGNLYGTTNSAGSSVFRLDPSGALTVLYGLGCGHTGCEPVAGLFRDPEGNLYGTASRGAGPYGAIFKLDTNNVYSRLHKFLSGADGAAPDSKLVSINGELYGTTLYGGGPGCFQNYGCGTIFKITKSGLLTILYRFTGGADGAYPQSLIRDSAGNLYGVAASNVTAPGGGTVFKFDTSAIFSVLHTFGLGNGDDGSYPVGRLTRDTNGDIHGVTQYGGSCCGVVFRLDADGNETIVHDFFGREGGANPTGGLLDVGGVLYGTTSRGGDLTCYLTSVGGCGVLYRISKTGEYTVLHQFVGAPGDGAWPLYGGLTLGADGSIYGTTRKGGSGTYCAAHGCGVIFKYTPASANETEVNP